VYKAKGLNEPLTEDEIPSCNLGVKNLLLQSVVCEIGFGEDALLPKICLDLGSILLLQEAEQEMSSVLLIVSSDIAFPLT
jgi:hypothetical protein